jgi:hypothetical protein
MLLLIILALLQFPNLVLGKYLPAPYMIPFPNHYNGLPNTALPTTNSPTGSTGDIPITRIVEVCGAFRGSNIIVIASSSVLGRLGYRTISEYG